MRSPLIHPLCLLAILFSFSSCGTGPAPKPVTSEQLRSGEAVARQAGEAASDKEQEPAVLYETSRGTLEQDPDPPAREIERDPESSEEMIEPADGEENEETSADETDADGQENDQQADESTEGDGE